MRVDMAKLQARPTALDETLVIT